MTDEKPQFEQRVPFIKAPPADAPDTDKINWLMHTGCMLGSVCTNLARQAGATDAQLALIFTYMYGRALAAYVPVPDEETHKACFTLYELGIQHGKEAVIENAMENRATVPGTETKQ